MGMVTLCTVGFFPIVAQIITLIDCKWQSVASEDSSEGFYILEAEPSKKCFDSEWWSSFFPLVLASSIVYGSLPLIINKLIRKNLDRLDDITGLPFLALKGFF